MIMCFCKSSGWKLMEKVAAPSPICSASTSCQMFPHICQLLLFNWKFRCSPFGLRRGQTIAHQSSRRIYLAKQMQAFDNQGHVHPSNNCIGQPVPLVRWLVHPQVIQDCEFYLISLFIAIQANPNLLGCNFILNLYQLKGCTCQQQGIPLSTYLLID